jgi:hypothetical protein
MSSVPAPPTVSWSTWAEHAQALTCPACNTSFQPNHPRRRFCGKPDCPGRTRRRVSHETSGATRPRTPRAASNALFGMVADALLRAHARPPSASDVAMSTAALGLARAVRAPGCTPAQEAEAIVQLLAIAARRAANQV